MDLSHLVPTDALLDVDERDDECWDSMDIYFDKADSDSGDDQNTSYLHCDVAELSPSLSNDDKVPLFANSASKPLAFSFTNTDVAYFQSLAISTGPNSESSSPCVLKTEGDLDKKKELKDARNAGSNHRSHMNSKFHELPLTPVESPVNSTCGEDAYEKESVGPKRRSQSAEEISDDELISLPVRELNKLLKGAPRSVMASLKQKRRLLKNRGYAQKCRTRRVQQYKFLSEGNKELYREINYLRNLVESCKMERDGFQEKYEKLKANRQSCKNCSNCKNCKY